MKNITKLLSIFGLLLPLLVSSCDSDMDGMDSSVPHNYKISPDEAIANLKDFMAGLDASRSVGYDVKDIKAVRRKTRSRSGDVTGEGDTLLYIVNFEDNQGFAVLGADERTEPIFALADEGNVTHKDSVSNDSLVVCPGYNDFIEGAETIAEWDIWYNDGLIVTSKEWNINNKRSPILITKWGQGDGTRNSYGRYCPNYITGCTVTATAQILSHFKNITFVQCSAGLGNINWYQITEDCKNYDGKLDVSSATSYSLDAIALLCRFLGISFDAKYNNNATTSAGKSKPVDWLNKCGLNATKLASYDEDKIIEAIRAGNPVYACGKSDKSTNGGHAWVYDGYVLANKDNVDKKFLHCNWGWDGLCNGYYLSRVFNTNRGPEIEDYEVYDTYSGEPYNYQYSLEYSIVSRPPKE